MKKNDKQLMSNFRQSYFMCINTDKKISENNALRADPGEHFDDAVISFEMYIPVPDSQDSIYRLKFQYIFQAYLTDDNKYHIRYNHADYPLKNNNRPMTGIAKFNASNLHYAVGDNDVFFTEFLNSSFSDFALKDCIKQINKFFKRINEKSFFNFNVDESKVVLSQELLSAIQKNVYYNISDFVEKIYKNDNESANYLYSHYSVNFENIIGFSNTIKSAEKIYSYTEFKNELTETLSKKSEDIQVKKPKI